jgi:oligoribonuclease (3'-5' exoribonuclease)
VGKRGPKYLLWIDLETTGTDHELDPILEIGAIITESDHPFDEVAEFERVIDPGTLEWKARLDDFVLNMHTENGLLNDIKTTKAVSPERAEADLCVLLAGYAKEHQFLLAGSGVSHFDRRFIATQMPKVHAFLQYPNLDVGISRRDRERAGRGDLIASGLTYTGSEHFDGKPHRGLADARDHLVEYRAYAEQLRSLPTP